MEPMVEGSGFLGKFLYTEFIRDGEMLALGI